MAARGLPVPLVGVLSFTLNAMDEQFAGMIDFTIVYRLWTGKDTEQARPKTAGKVLEVSFAINYVYLNASTQTSGND